ncbi:MAG: type I glyceraldehyde-3-phosphate dehydrogenase [Erysipelotrichaceae bacterium]|jgi:glyceraldehyde 3-phosphate dehydrogenase|nr:type I glyceraldehyde-3-phosphate dehydrogenase [Erysipelotrichaceae bacterium]
MSKIKLAINGFGRIGRLAFRRAYETGDFEVVAINDLVGASDLAYLLKYDTTHRNWHLNDISFNAEKNAIIFEGKEIPVLGKKDPAELNWGDYGVDIVLECTGRFKGKEDAAIHIKNGAKGVIISAPSGSDTPTFVYGVNTDTLTKDMTVISGASCTTNCLAPVMKVLVDKFGVVGGYMTTVHAYTNDQTTLDLAKGNRRRGRAAAMNIIPTSTGAAKAIGLVIPCLDGRMKGGALRVPVADGSLVDLSLVLEKKVTVDEVNAAMKEAAETNLKDILDYTEDEIVSSDILGYTSGSIFDATQTVVLNTPDGTQFVKVVSWYDNEYSYTCQFIRLAKEMAKVMGIK